MKELTNVYANYLMGFTWDSYWTQTFRTKRNDSVNTVTAWWNILENKLGYTRAFCAVERHRLGGVHLHALVADDLSSWDSPSLGRLALIRHQARAKKYTDKAFGWTAVSQARNQATVNLYCAKYVTKDNGDYWFLGHWDKDCCY